MTVLDELLAFTAFSAGDAARLRALHPALAPHFPAIADRFYEAAQASPATAALLASPAQVERLRTTLIDWMSTGLLGPHDEAFYEKRTRIGRRHVAIGLAHHHMFTAMSVVRAAYLDRIAALYPPDEALAMVRAVDKLLDIELAVMVQHYHLDSEERLVQRERRIQRDRLLAVQTLSAGLAHEVRNPINAAKLQLELLERRLRRDGIDAKHVEPSALARHELERLTTLLDDFLTFARPPELHAEDGDAAEVVRRVVELERATAARRSAVLELAACPARLPARVDGAKLHQIVLNLVRNALEAVAPGGRVEVELAAAPDGGGGGVRIVVTDDGPGIPLEVQPRIYEPFFSTKEAGTGLGMSIVHSLVALHGGTIRFQTGAGGTRFEVALPRRPGPYQ